MAAEDPRIAQLRALCDRADREYTDWQFERITEEIRAILDVAPSVGGAIRTPEEAALAAEALRSYAAGYIVDSSDGLAAEALAARLDPVKKHP